MPTKNDSEILIPGTASPDSAALSTPPLQSPSERADQEQDPLKSDSDTLASAEPADPEQLSFCEAVSRLPSLVAPEPEVDPATGTLYCPECYLPLHPDPKPEKLYIFLHALKYELSLGCFETAMPEWAKEGYQWEP